MVQTSTPIPTSMEQIISLARMTWESKDKTLKSFWRKCIMLFVRFFGMLVTLPSIMERFKKIERIPPIHNPILLKSAKKLTKMIREGKIKSEDVVKAYIERCEQVNTTINAIVENRYELALDEARKVDKLVSSGEKSVQELEELYPLLGIPVSIKGSISVKGMVNSAGSCEEDQIPSSEDAPAVSNLRAAGAIPLVTTNTPEYCLCSETFNYKTGITRNPYDTRKTPGGSSGGEAALISSGGSLIGIGSDVGGSLRIPAMFCGIFSHKPTPEAVSTLGHNPSSDHEDWRRIFTLGPMARYAEDLPLVMKAIQDPKGTKLQLDTKVKLTDLKFYYMMDEDRCDGSSKIDKDIQEAMHRVLNHLSSNLNITFKQARMKYMKYTFNTGFMKVYNMNLDLFTNQKVRSVWMRLVEKILGVSKSILPVVIYGVVMKVMRLIPSDVLKKANGINARSRKEFTDLLQHDGVLICPTFPHTAHFHSNYLRLMPDMSYTIVFNSVELPTTNCPAGLTREGMPVGVQIVAGPKQDHLLMAVAEEFQRLLGGWVEPPCESKKLRENFIINDQCA